MDNPFEELKIKATDVRVTGCFLLSIAEMSDFWIDINEFNNPSSIDALTNITRGVIKCLTKRYGSINIIVPYYNKSSEKIFP